MFYLHVSTSYTNSMQMCLFLYSIYGRNDKFKKVKIPIKIFLNRNIPVILCTYTHCVINSCKFVVFFYTKQSWPTNGRVKNSMCRKDYKLYTLFLNRSNIIHMYMYIVGFSLVGNKQSTLLIEVTWQIHVEASKNEDIYMLFNIL